MAHLGASVSDRQGGEKSRHAATKGMESTLGSARLIPGIRLRYCTFAEASLSLMINLRE
jgi:hypothetical protein